MRNGSGMLFEGLLGGSGVSFSRRGLDGLVWRESEGICYRVDAMLGRVGVELFVAGGVEYENDEFMEL